MPPFCGRIHSSEHAPPESLFFFFNDTATTEIYTLSLHDALPILIVALRIKTGGLGCRAYVDGYCGRATLVLSADAAGAAATGAGSCAGRVPPPAEAHAPVSASSRDHNDRILVSSVPSLLDEFDDEWLSHEFRFENASRSIGAHVHRKWDP